MCDSPDHEAPETGHAVIQSYLKTLDSSPGWTRKRVFSMSARRAISGHG
jgi:hypothetical protein